MEIKINYQYLSTMLLSLIKLKKDYRRYINLFLLIIWVTVYYHYLFTDWYHVNFKFWGTTFFILPVIGFLIQIIYPTILGWGIQTWINTVYLYNYISSCFETYVYNFPIKWGLEMSVSAFQSDMIYIALYVLFVIFMIPGKEKRILNSLKILFIIKR